MQRRAECCRANGLLAGPALHHFTNRRWLARAGGWENPEVAEHSGRYAAVGTRWADSPL